MKDCKITIRIEESLKNDIMEYAKKKDIPTAQAIREAIKNYLKENK